MKSFDTPILLIIYNRPDLAQRLFAIIRALRPTQLFVVADGPKAGYPDDALKCEASRKIIQQIDWHCELHTCFRDKNLGCGEGPAQGITWFFEHTSEGIILEDDCLPEDSFFWFCQELLETYRDNEQIMHIGGSNFQFGQMRGEGSYYFSKYAEIWGWATWKRAWQHFDLRMEQLPHFIESKAIEQVFSDRNTQKYWLKKLCGVHKTGHTWDYQWLYTIWSHNGLAVTPNYNLVSNVGFREDATHTFYPDHPIAKRARTPVESIIHAKTVAQHVEADSFTYSVRYNVSLMHKIMNQLYHHTTWLKWMFDTKATYYQKRKQ